MAKKPGDPKKWGYVFFQEGEVAPAREWLISLPKAIRQELLKTIDAVLWTKNPPAAYLPNRWHSMRHELPPVLSF